MEALRQVVETKCGGVVGKGVMMRQLLNYYLADEHYEAEVVRQISSGSVSRWVDVGCGHDLFPWNKPLADDLRAKVDVIGGIDPDANIHDNPYLDCKHHGPVETAEIGGGWDLVTMRMVAEHVEFPQEAMAKVRDMLKPGGKVIIYTPWKWSPISWVARFTPMSIHHLGKRIFWGTEERDTFPVQYKMNTRRALSYDGFELEQYKTFPDCSALQRWWWINAVEIMASKVLRRLYPERCIVAVLRRS